ncbi:MAG TPA: hypothetical protein VFR19_11905 [Hyphomicrobiaceae bacterium]|jgi:hypothetical protein|nr:hypothetical protein [Hyphomicrobiaceae bacterium]
MRLAILWVLSVLMSFAVIADAGASDKKRKTHKHAAGAPAAAASGPQPERYRELLADKMPIGSSQWWEQMRREGRLGGETP